MDERLKPDKPFSIVSGGQAGADRAALDAALQAGVPCGGWCPPQRRAEDGPIPLHYPLRCIAQGGYIERTRANVLDSDGTLVVTFGRPTGGTAATAAFCVEATLPLLVVDGALFGAAAGAAEAAAFVLKWGIRTLNVAGPRASREARSYPYTFDLIATLLARVALVRG